MAMSYLYQEIFYPFFLVLTWLEYENFISAKSFITCRLVNHNINLLLDIDFIQKA